MYSSTLSLTSVLGGREWLRPHPGRFIPGKVTQCPLCGRRGGPQNRCGAARKNQVSPIFDPRNVELVASRYTNWAIPNDFLFIHLRQLTVSCIVEELTIQNKLLEALSYKCRNTSIELNVEKGSSRNDLLFTFRNVPLETWSWKYENAVYRAETSEVIAVQITLHLSCFCSSMYHIRKTDSGGFRYTWKVRNQQIDLDTIHTWIFFVNL
jgi:hypothetical protein